MTSSRLDHTLPLDADAHIALAPADRKVRGFFHAYLRDMAEKNGFNVHKIPLIDAQKDIFLREALGYDVMFAQLFYPHAPLRDGLRRVGWFRLPALMVSPVAKLIFNTAKMSPRLMMRAVPHASSLSGSLATVRVIESINGRAVFDVDRYHAFRDCFIGAIEAGLASCGVQPTVIVRAESELKFELIIEWREDRPRAAGRYSSFDQV
jgi:uncharacterized protein (TIGR02265 family)